MNVSQILSSTDTVAGEVSCKDYLDAYERGLQGDSTMVDH